MKRLAPLIVLALLSSCLSMKTPLMRAADRCNAAKAESALAGGVDLDARDNLGWTALHYAVFCSPEMTELLLRAGADPDIRDVCGNSPLHMAAKYGKAGIVAALLEHGADRALTNKDGKTPATIALEEGHTEAARYIDPSVSLVPDPGESSEVLPRRQGDYQFAPAGERRLQVYHRVDNGKSRYVTTVASAYHLAVSPDGHSIVFYRNRRVLPRHQVSSRLRKSGIYVYAADTGYRHLVPQSSIVHVVPRKSWITLEDPYAQYERPDYAGDVWADMKEEIRRLLQPDWDAGYIVFTSPTPDGAGTTRRAATTDGSVLPLACVGGTVLHQAAYDGDMELLAASFASGVDPTQPNAFTVPSTGKSPARSTR